MTTGSPKTEDSKPGENCQAGEAKSNPTAAATRVAGAAYQSQLPPDKTRLAQEVGYQSILATRLGLPPTGAPPGGGPPKPKHDKVGPSPAEEPAERYKIGDMIGGRYEVLAIHCGAMGVVYGTFDHQERLPRALKTLQQRFADNKNMRDLFAEEAAIWVRLEKHPFIVRAYLVEKFDGQPYVVTEYVRGQGGMGGDLRAWLGHPRLTLPVAVEMALQTAQGMQHATRKVPGLVHRDLKPANVLVDDRGRATVTDFETGVCGGGGGGPAAQGTGAAEG
jgi:serine/threonine-protein kinase